MKHIRRTAIVAALTGAVAGAFLSSASPAQAWCTSTIGSPSVASAWACSSLDCGVNVLGDRVFTCP